MIHAVTSDVAVAKVVLRACVALIGRLRVEPQRLGLVLHYAVAVLVAAAEVVLGDRHALGCVLDELLELLHLGSRTCHLRLNFSTTGSR
eukprot:CAMPEP_0179855532 /NCGR_PEP_ID=MMETSP0982-20121206/10590_1 /TAXON_ID=483367 /ORGANISM="non described non described, Strain CCMP 2436" /LENGTH=88 /DNA_ID=CAMNT_0021741637 /DNA_START=464 /DNA_END=730 /DNA_ORIENTATION=-